MYLKIIFMLVLFMCGCAKKEETKTRNIYEPRPAQEGVIVSNEAPVPLRDTIYVYRDANTDDGTRQIISTFKTRVDACNGESSKLIVLALEAVTRMQVGTTFSTDELIYVQDALAKVNIQHRVRIEKRISKAEFTQYYVFLDVPQGNYYHIYICTTTDTNQILSVETKESGSNNG